MRKTGQAILEYVIILTAVIAVIIYAARDVIQPAVWKVMASAGRVVESGGERMVSVRGESRVAGLVDGMAPVDNATLGVFSRAAAGRYYAGLLKDKNVDVSYLDYDKFRLDPRVGAEWSSGYNALVVNSRLMKADSANVAALLAHEAVHADYSFNPGKWAEDALQRFAHLQETDLHIERPPGNSIDQEYNAFKAQVAVWDEVCGEKPNENNDGWTAVMLQGEDDAKAFIRQAHSDSNDPWLPEV